MARLSTIVGFLSLPFTAFFVLAAIVIIPLSSFLSTGGFRYAFSGAWLGFAFLAAILLSITIGAFRHARGPALLGILTLPLTGFATFVAIMFWTVDVDAQDAGFAFFFTIAAAILLAVTIGAFWHVHAQKKSAQAVVPTFQVG